MGTTQNDLFSAKQSLGESDRIFNWAEETLNALSSALYEEDEPIQGIVLEVGEDHLRKFKTGHVLADFFTPFGDGRVVLHWLPVSDRYMGQQFGGNMLNAEVVAQIKVHKEQHDQYEHLHSVRIYKPGGANISDGWMVDSRDRASTFEKDAWYVIVHKMILRIKEQFENS